MGGALILGFIIMTYLLGDKTVKIRTVTHPFPQS